MSKEKVFSFEHKDGSIVRLKGEDPFPAFLSGGYNKDNLSDFVGYKEVATNPVTPVIIKAKMTGDYSGFLGEVIDIVDANIALYPTILSDTLEKVLVDWDYIQTKQIEGTGVFVICEEALIDSYSFFIKHVITKDIELKALDSVVNHCEGSPIDSEVFWDLGNKSFIVVGKDNCRAVYNSIWDEVIFRREALGSQEDVVQIKESALA